MINNFYVLKLKKLSVVMVVVGLSLATAGCFTKTIQRGNVVTQAALRQAPIGASKDQVLIALGTPSAKATFNRDTFYYISQIKKQNAFFKPKVFRQDVVVIDFDRGERVKNISRYGLKDGRVFDPISGKTITGGKDMGFLQQLLQGLLSSRPVGL